ncbi:unnamed protein product [Mytilus edulis]|uniref:Uncharacterized protein n=1 Tax=Mytilus edulis TaxID=6550 RepID=A0A8S3R0L7_MYTED|nr:unnamed protein product [Mytilus edulis]
MPRFESVPRAVGCLSTQLRQITCGFDLSMDSKSLAKSQSFNLFRTLNAYRAVCSMHKYPTTFNHMFSDQYSSHQKRTSMCVECRLDELKIFEEEIQDKITDTKKNRIGHGPQGGAFITITDTNARTDITVSTVTTPRITEEKSTFNKGNNERWTVGKLRQFFNNYITAREAAESQSKEKHILVPVLKKSSSLKSSRTTVIFNQENTYLQKL